MNQANKNTDEYLLAQAISGDEDAFKKIIKRYESKIAGIVFGMLGNCPEAEEVGQDTFIRFYKSMDNFKQESSLGTYLSRIAINLSLNELKRRKRKFSLFSTLEDSKHQLENFRSYETAEQKDIKELVHLGISKLNRKYKSVVVLRMIEGYSTKETAEILDLPLGTVLSRLMRGQQKLKKIIEKLK